MDFRLTEEHSRLQQRCRDLAGDFAVRSAEHDRDATHPTENYQRLREEGFLELNVAKEWGELCRRLGDEVDQAAW